MKNFVLLAILGLTGCSTVTTTTSSQECLDARQTQERFNIVSPTEVEVLSRGRWYRVTLDHCDISAADRIAFSNGPERMVWYGNQQAFAAQLYSGQICGRAGDMIVWRQHFEDFRFPGHTCRVSQVQRIVR
jgi:hypothetical protein